MSTEAKALIKKKSEGLAPIDKLKISMENILPLINKDDDFVIFKDKKTGKANIEPTRDLALKVFTHFNLSYDTEIVKIDDKMAIVKAIVWNDGGRKASSFGLCTLQEISFGSGNRNLHDCLTKAETRALKRAIEALAGTAIINQIIKRIFGGYEIKSEKNVTNSGYADNEAGKQEIIKEIVSIMNTPQLYSEKEKTEIRKTIGKAKTCDDLLTIKNECEEALKLMQKNTQGAGGELGIY